MKKAGSTFSKRLEDKYVVNRRSIKSSRLMKLLMSSKFSIDAFNKDTKFTRINNIYFDSTDLKSYHDARSKKDVRHKIRIRTYAPNGIADDKFYFEVKSKVNGKTEKKRVTFSQVTLDAFIDTGDYDINEICLLNPKESTKSVIENMNTLHNFIHKKNYRPMLQTSYTRYAYKLRDNDKLRITIDTEINIERIGASVAPQIEYKRSIEKNDLIVEVKYLGSEVSSKVQEVKSILGEKQGFSKFSFGIYNTHVDGKSHYLNESLAFISKLIK